MVHLHASRCDYCCHDLTPRLQIGTAKGGPEIPSDITPEAQNFLELTFLLYVSFRNLWFARWLKADSTVHLVEIITQDLRLKSCCNRPSSPVATQEPHNKPPQLPTSRCNHFTLPLEQDAVHARALCNFGPHQSRAIPCCQAGCLYLTHFRLAVSLAAAGWLPVARSSSP